MTWPLALATGGFVDRPVVEVLAAAHDAGVEQVEIGTPPKHFAPWDRVHIDALTRELSRTGIVPLSMHAPFGGVLDLAEFNPQHRQAAVAAILTAAEALAEVGGRMIVVHPSDVPRRDHEVEHRLACCASALQELAESLAPVGVRLVVETPLPHLIGGRPDEFARLLSVLPPDTGACFDTGHAHLGRHWHGFMHVAASRLVHVHATDTRGQFDDHLPPGDGEINWADIRGTLAAANYGGAIVLELGSGTEPMVPYFRRALEQARRLLAP